MRVEEHEEPSETVAGDAGRATQGGRVGRWIPPAVAATLIVLSWQIVGTFYAVALENAWLVFHLSPPVPDLGFLSSPFKVLLQGQQEFIDGSLFEAVGTTTLHTLVSFFIAWGLGLPVANLIGSSRIIRDALLPLAYAASGVPPVALLPLLLVAFQLGAGSVVALAVVGASLTVVLGCYEVQLALPTDLPEILQRLGYSSRSTSLWKLSTAAAGLQSIAREALRWSLILSVVGEMHGAIAGGLGAYIDSGRLNQNYAVVYLGILACALLAGLLKVFLGVSGSWLHRGVKAYLLRF